MLYIRVSKIFSWVKLYFFFVFDNMNRTPIESIKICRSRYLFTKKMADIGVKAAPYQAVTSLDEV